MAETSAAFPDRPVMVSGLPFDDMRNLVRALPGPDALAEAGAQRIVEQCGAVSGGLGEAGGIAVWLAAWTGRPPRVLRPVVALFAGTHGLARGEAAAVRAFVERCAAGGSAVNSACVAGDLGLKVFDLALDVPTADITAGPALDERAVAATMAFGMEAIAGGSDLLVLGGFGGSGGEAAAAAVLAALHGADALPADSPASGPVSAALSCHAGHLRDPLEVLRRVGGREIAALVGAIVAARMEKVAVILDGAAALAAAAVVAALEPGGVAHCMAGDRGSSAIADRAAARLGLRAVVDLGMATGDAAGGAIAAGVVKAAALVHAGAAEVARRATH